jgi:uncharacterized membrane protein
VYQLLLYVHIVCAILWVGGSFYVQMLAIRVDRADDPAEIPRLARHIEALGNRVFVPAAGLLLLSGLAMTVQAWGFGQTWIVISIALWLLSAVAGAVYLAPRAKRAADLFETEGPTSVAGLGLVRRMFLVSRLELLSFAVVVALMVFKPNT